MEDPEDGVGMQHLPVVCHLWIGRLSQCIAIRESSIGEG